MRNTRAVTSNKNPLPATMPAMPRLCWHRCTGPKRCWVRQLRPSRVITTHNAGNTVWWSFRPDTKKSPCPVSYPSTWGDLRRKRRVSRESNLSPQLKQACEEALKNGEQVILFQNRRGFAPMVECRLCAWTPRCTQCDVSLTYHKHTNRLVCHYCGYSQEVPTRCPACGENEYRHTGFWDGAHRRRYRTYFSRLSHRPNGSRYNPQPQSLRANHFRLRTTKKPYSRRYADGHQKVSTSTT